MTGPAGPGVRSTLAEQSTEILGTFRGRTYYLTLRVSPDYDRVRNFAAVVHYSTAGPTERHIQIARIDTAHGYTHFDRLYRRDRPKERLDIDVWDALDLLHANWRTYAESHYELQR